jgi:hypothetical protein
MDWDYLTKLLLRLLLSETGTLSGRVNLVILSILVLAGWNWILANLRDLFYYFVLIVFSTVISDYTRRNKRRRGRK